MNAWDEFLRKIAATAPSLETIVNGLLMAAIAALIQWFMTGGQLTDKTAYRLGLRLFQPF
jgi:hypothetical protein